MRNILTRLKPIRVNYLIENTDWSIKWDGIYITESLIKQFKCNARVRLDFKNLRRTIIHFGSRNIYLPDSYKSVHGSNNVIFTWFHGTADDEVYINALPEGSKRADVIHTSCQISKKLLIEWGAQQQKIIVIPLGIDLNLFKPLSYKKKLVIRKKLGIPENVILIGSFQKDGNGWKEGNTPKLIKGPDIFCNVVERLAEKYPIYILLTGPARGYVKNRLMKAKIPFRHFYLKDYKQIGNYFNILDLYIIGSRAEGGPKAILESLASGVPLVSTKVGMAPDVLKHGENAFLAEVGDVEKIVYYARKIIEDSSLQHQLTKNGLAIVQKYEWDIIARAYYNQIYSQFL